MADKVGKVWGLGSNTRRTRAPGRASSATCGSRRSRRPVVPRRQPAPVAPLFAVPGAAIEGAPRGHPDPGLWAAEGASQELKASPCVATASLTATAPSPSRGTRCPRARPAKPRPLGGRRLDRDAGDVDAGDFGDAGAHRLAIGADLRRFANERRVEMDEEAAARANAFRRMGEKDLRRRALPLWVGRREMVRRYRPRRARHRSRRRAHASRRRRPNGRSAPG